MTPFPPPLRHLAARVRTVPAVIALLATCAGAANVAHADGHMHAAPTVGAVNLTASAHREIDNDTMRVTLFAEDEDVAASKLADRVNRAVNDAVRIAKAEPKVKVTTGGYQTFPVYEKSRIVRWRARAELQLESREFRVLSELTGRLQSTLKLGGIGFSVSPEARHAIEDELTREAIADFKRRAQLVAESFDAKAWTMREVSVSADGGYVPMPRPMLAMRSKAMESDAVEAPQVEAGTSRIGVTVGGSVVLGDGR
ncbi:MAG: SIMPL domain-containing protein [Burkholderiales bacterium]|jgi:predicted secreted protein|nr:SIMPL domain-containing protein [Burkholderiales bacterium]